VPFSPSTPWQPALPEAPVTFTAVPARDFQAEAGAVCHLVAELRARGDAGRIAVLVRGRRHLAQVYPALRAAGIPCRAIEIEPLAESPVIRDLEALTRALSHRADRTAWLAVLRAPWCGLGLADLLRVAGDEEGDVWLRMQQPEVLADLTSAGRERVERVVATLQPAVDARGRSALRRVVQGAWLALGGPATLERPSELTDAHNFFDFLDQRAGQGDLDDPVRLGGQLADLYAVPETAAEDAVELLTIHKAKGLEFDHVILPALDRRTGRNEKQLLRWLEQTRAEGPELVLAPLEALGEEPDRLHKALQELEGRRDQLELDRLLYVATTRPVRQLHLVAGIGRDDPDTGRPWQPAAGSLLARLWDSSAGAFRDALARRRAPTDPAPAAVPAVLRRFPAGWVVPAPPAAVPWATMQEPPPDLGAMVEYDWSGREARAVGRAVHRLLQVIAAEGPAAWPAKRLEAQRRLLAMLLQEAGLGGAELSGGLEHALQALHTTLADPRGRWLLDPGHEQACSELAVSGWLDDRLVNGIIDRSFVDEEGLLWIVDYNAGLHEGSDLDAFLDREQERYRPQLERYARLMAAGDDRPMRLGLYFPRHAAWRVWEPGTG
jgi:ATP-dependent exoDNAse (exonuclease V) beta subunit